MDESKYDYPFPNMVFVFWLFTFIPFCLLALFWWNFTNNGYTGQLRDEYTSIASLLIILCIVVPVISTILFNSFPAIRIDMDGLKIRFYFPLLSKWYYLPWKSIDRINTRLSPANVLFNKSKKELFVFSEKLPLYYYIPALMYGHSLQRGFIIGRNIARFETLYKTLDEHLGIDNITT